MSTCFTYPLVGVRGLCTEAPSSGLYVDDIPGVSVKKFANVADEVAHTAKDMSFKLHQESVRLTEIEFYDKLGNDFNLDHVIETRVYGTIGSTYKKEAECGEKGIRITRKNSDKYVSLRVDSFEVKSLFDTQREVIITDGCKIVKICIDLKAGCTHEIDLNFETKECEIMIYMDFTDLILADTKSCNCGNSKNCYECCQSCFNVCGIEYNCGAWVDTSILNGIRVCVSCVCDGCFLLKRLKKEFSNAVKYMYAALLMEEVLSTERSNPIVRNSQETARRIIAKILGGEDPVTGYELKDRLFDKAIDKIVNSAKRIIEREESACFSCSNKRLQIVNTLP